MNARRWLCLALVLTIAGFLPAMAQSKAVRLDGWVVDEKSGKKNANAEGAGSVKSSHEEGSPLVFYSPDEDRIYSLDKQEESLKFVGKKVRVFGVVDTDGGLRVGQFVEIEAADGDDEEAGAEKGS